MLLVSSIQSLSCVTCPLKLGCIGPTVRATSSSVVALPFLVFNLDQTWPDQEQLEQDCGLRAWNWQDNSLRFAWCKPNSIMSWVTYHWIMNLCFIHVLLIDPLKAGSWRPGATHRRPFSQAGLSDVLSQNRSISVNLTNQNDSYVTDLQ